MLIWTITTFSYTITFSVNRYTSRFVGTHKLCCTTSYQNLNFNEFLKLTKVKILTRVPRGNLVVYLGHPKIKLYWKPYKIKGTRPTTKLDRFIRPIRTFYPSITLSPSYTCLVRTLIFSSSASNHRTLNNKSIFLKYHLTIRAKSCICVYTVELHLSRQILGNNYHYKVIHLSRNWVTQDGLLWNGGVRIIEATL